MSDDTNRTFLAIDYGRRRIGLARSDPSGIIASALTTLEIKSTSQAMEKLAGLIEENAPAALVVGYPLLASGDRSKICDEVDTFVTQLEKIYAGPIHKIDEYGSSAEAAGIIHKHGKRVGKDKKRLDRLAAVIILQRFLDEHQTT